jgi:hypothetical protein
MISRDFAKRQIGRLESLAFFPRRAEGIAELIDTLVECARSEPHAKHVITRLLDSPECPTPADIRRIAWDLIESQAEEQRARCPICHGVGYVIVERGCYTGADPCSCRPAPATAAGGCK